MLDFDQAFDTIDQKRLQTYLQLFLQSKLEENLRMWPIIYSETSHIDMAASNWLYLKREDYWQEQSTLNGKVICFHGQVKRYWKRNIRTRWVHVMERIIKIEYWIACSWLQELFTHTQKAHWRNNNMYNWTNVNTFLVFRKVLCLYTSFSKLNERNICKWSTKYAQGSTYILHY